MVFSENMLAAETGGGTGNALRAGDRLRFWQWAAELGQSGPRGQVDVWRLELVKVLAEAAESSPGLMPDPDQAATRVSLQHSVRSRLVFVVGVLLAIAAFAVWAIRFMPWRAAGLSPGTSRLAAVHAEWSTRTQHVLRALAAVADEHPASPEAVILLGRLRDRPEDAAAVWRDKGVSLSVRMVLPLSPRAAGAALVDMPALLLAGWRAAGWLPVSVGLRDWAAIAFRCFLGAVAARWWRHQPVAADARVVFGITGTADVSLLERSIQAGGGTTVHAVHGQATGANFAGISDLALFRSAHDADCYRRLRCYGACEVQRAEPPPFRRGETGLLLLTNLAHPMNKGYVGHGIRDERFVIIETAKAAEALGVAEECLWWKPHPVLESLPEAQELDATAAEAGFTRLSADDEPLHATASRMRWVVTTPSTVALDLLEQGVLPVVVDPQDSVLDTALRALPMTDANASAISECLAGLDAAGRAKARFAEAFEAIGPAQAFDLKPVLG